MTTATVKVMSAEEIVAQAGGQTPFFQWPERRTLFAERAMRLRQLASGHAMQDYLVFIADLALAQQAALAEFPEVPLPDAAALDRAAGAGIAPLAALDWPRDAAWHGVLRGIAARLQASAPDGAQAVLARLGQADAAFLEQQADALLCGTPEALDMGAAPVVAAALQVYWTHLVLAVQQRHLAAGQPFGRVDDETLCPCCASRPTVSLTRMAGNASGQRYLHCALCSTQWHMVRIRCTHCGAGEGIAYQSLDLAGADDDGRQRSPAILAECCERCGHYLKILHTERDPLIEPVADDLASLTLDLLVADSGLQRHGVNLLLLFGDSPPPPPERP